MSCGDPHETPCSEVLETVYLYPWAVAYGRLGLFALIEMTLFLGILVCGLVYAWRKGALEWL